MNRRTFIKTTSAAGLSLTVLSCVPGARDDKSRQDEVSGPDEFELNEATIDDLQSKMASGVFTAQQLTRLYLDRIAAVDKNGPGLNSVIEVNPDALAIAASLDDERRSGKVRGPLHGIPVLVKDNIDTGDKMQTTAGALAMEGHIARKDSFVVQKLREAGVVLLGKTNLSEWANFRSEKSTSGWSSRGGQTKNPYILDRNPLGSSSGSGAAVAANLCAVAVGTETDGSVVCPSSVNGIVGIKPTVGLVSRAGIIPISQTQDTAGPMARTVRDAAILLGAMTGKDPEDKVTMESQGKSFADFTRFLSADALRGKRIGIDRKWKSTLEPVNGLFEKALALMKEKGAEILEVSYSEEIGTMGKEEFEVLKFEFKEGLNKYLAKSRAKMRSLKDIIAFNKANAEKAMPFFGQDILESSEAKAGLDSPDYIQAVKKTSEGSRLIIREIMKECGLHAISGLTMSPPGCTDLVYGDRFGDLYAGMAAAISGFPHVTVPCGNVFGLPVGISFFGDAYGEPELLAIAYAYEQASKMRIPPRFLPVLEG